VRLDWRRTRKDLPERGREQPEHLLGDSAVHVTGPRRGKKAAMSQVKPGVDVHTRPGQARLIAGQSPPQRRREADGGARVASGRVSEMLLLAWRADVGKGGVEVGAPGRDAPAEPAPADKHHPVFVTHLGVRPANMVVPARHRCDREIGPLGETDS
jgi:hypothetical protein